MGIPSSYGDEVTDQFGLAPKMCDAHYVRTPHLDRLEARSCPLRLVVDEVDLLEDPSLFVSFFAHDVYYAG